MFINVFIVLSLEDFHNERKTAIKSRRNINKNSWKVRRKWEGRERGQGREQRGRKIDFSPFPLFQQRAAHWPPTPLHRFLSWAMKDHGPGEEYVQTLSSTLGWLLRHRIANIFNFITWIWIWLHDWCALPIDLLLGILICSFLSFLLQLYSRACFSFQSQF